MKTFIALLTYALTLSSAFASSRLVGRLEAGCPIQAQVVHFQTNKSQKLLIVEDRQVQELILFKKQGGVTFFRSKSTTSFPPTFEARIMSPAMGRLSEVGVYFSGRKIDCLIDVQ